jgi:FKBP-type peptidyl-prolyl cis-trans isomerase SlyD
MDSSAKPNLVADDLVITMDYTLMVDDEMVDSTDGGEPIEFLQGHKNIIPGLEAALYGMETGDEKEVSVQPAAAYGEYDPDRLVEVPKDQIDENVDMKVGAMLHLEDNEGHVHDARISSVDDNKVTFDLNHPLAGKSLNFTVRIVDLRAATPEELTHGHVHGEGHAH